MHPVLEISLLDSPWMCSDPSLFQALPRDGSDQTPPLSPPALISSNGRLLTVTDGRDHNIVTNVSDEENRVLIYPRRPNGQQSSFPRTGPYIPTPEGHRTRKIKDCDTDPSD